MKTLDLLDKATADGTSARDLARRLGFSENAMNAARNRGHLSGELAGALANHLDLEPGPWMALAVVEGAKKPLPAGLTQKVKGAVGKTLAGLIALGVAVTLCFGLPGDARAADANVYYVNWH